MSLTEADKKKKTRPASEDLTNLRDLEDKLEREKERNEELARQLKEEREKLDKQPPANKRKWRVNDFSVKEICWLVANKGYTVTDIYKGDTATSNW